MGKAFIKGYWFKIAGHLGAMRYNNWSKIMFREGRSLYILPQLIKKGEVIS